MSHEVETMFSARERPWHFSLTEDRTTITENVVDAETAIEVSGLDWKVGGIPIYGDFDGALLPLDGYQAIRRETDGQVYAIVSDRYVPIQNLAMFQFVEALLDGGGLYETAGSLKEGALVWAMVKLDREIKFANDLIRPYLMISTSHDASQAFMAYPTGVRVVCANTHRFALEGANLKWSIRHTTNAEGRVAEAKEALGMTHQYFDDFEAEVEALIEQEVGVPTFESIVTTAFPTDEDSTKAQEAKAERRRETVRMLYYESPTVRPFIDTGWGVLNAFNEWEQWSTRAMNPTPEGIASFSEKYMLRNLTNNYPVSNTVSQALVAIR